MKPNPQGLAAEAAALAFLQQQGCRLLARNWHCPFGEIDLIMQHDGILLFVEVKYRKTAAYGGAAYSITAAKLGKLQRSAEYYLQHHAAADTPCRLDAVLLEGGRPPLWLHNITG